MPTIYFRTDGNEEIATGHIMRCLSIARACAMRHAKVCFLVADETSISALQERFAHRDEFAAYCLHSDYRKPETELTALRSIAEESSLIFLDSYFITKTYLHELHKLFKVAYLDDMLAFDYPVDLIINYDITERPSCYRKAAHTLISAAYTPLREQFRRTTYEVRPDVQNILISSGGTDSYDIAGKLLHKIFAADEPHSCEASKDKSLFYENLKTCSYHVVTSRFNSHFQELQKLSLSYPAIHIHENIQDMAAFMKECDLAVSAGGTTLYELCAIGVPSVSFSMADNQLQAVKTMAMKKIIPYAGDVRFTCENTINAMLSFLSDHIRSYDKRKKSSQCMRAFVDGNGSARIAEALIRYADS